MNGLHFRGEGLTLRLGMCLHLTVSCRTSTGTRVSRLLALGSLNCAGRPAASTGWEGSPGQACAVPRSRCRDPWRPAGEHPDSSPVGAARAREAAVVRRARSP